MCGGTHGSRSTLHYFCRAGPVCPAGSAVGRADVGSELSAAGGRGSEVSEWPRSKFPASAVRQRRNFGHRNRNIRTPVPSAPLPKGGWHGEAVTGGFFSHIPNNVSVGAGFYPARSSAPLVTDAGRCGHRPLQNPIGKPSVGADAYIGPLPGLHKFPCHP